MEDKVEEKLADIREAADKLSKCPAQPDGAIMAQALRDLSDAIEEISRRITELA